MLVRAYVVAVRIDYLLMVLGVGLLDGQRVVVAMHFNASVQLAITFVVDGSWSQ